MIKLWKILAPLAVVGTLSALAIDRSQEIQERRGPVVEERTAQIFYSYDESTLVSQTVNIKEYQNGTVNLDAGALIQYFDDPSANNSPSISGLSEFFGYSPSNYAEDIYQRIMEQQ